MPKEQYIQEILKLLHECGDIDLIELVYQIMLKGM